MSNIILNSVYLSILWVLIFTGPRTLYSLKADISSSTPARGTTTQMVTGTPGTSTVTATPGPTLTPSPTTTLMPLPAITLIYPASTNISSPTKTPNESQSTPSTTPITGEENIPPRIRIIAIVLILLWLLLAGYLVIYIRQLF